MNEIRLKRIYEAAEAEDGYRILADRLWPRGIKKVDARIDDWAKDISPSNDLRKKFHADDDYEAFEKDYALEMDANENMAAFVSLVREKLKEGNVTFLTASKNPERCNISVLLKYVQNN